MTKHRRVLLAMVSVTLFTAALHANETIGTDSFVYDAAGRLVRGDTNGVSRLFEYDGFGNRTACREETCSPSGCIDGGGCMYGLTPVKATNQVSGVGVSYDGAGNATQFGGHAFTYDAVNMPMRQVTPTVTREYVYTASDERIAVFTTGANTWQWTVRDTGGKVLREFTSTGSQGTNDWQWSKDYVYRENQLLASRQLVNGTPVTFHYHLDHLGTPRRITNDSDVIVGAHDYVPFGPRASSGYRENPLSLMKYTGHERDIIGEENPETLDYMHARYYSPYQGRFLSVDPSPKSIRLGMPQTWNRYSYVLNNPLRYIDPTGELWFNVGGDWTYLKDQDVIYEATSNGDGTTTVTEVQGLESFGTFNGSTFTHYRADGTTRSFVASSGEVDWLGRSATDRQNVPDVGALPEGRYSFRTESIQRYDDLPLIHKLVGPLGLGRWAGGRDSWGDARVDLIPDKSNRMFGRSAFTIHGGEKPGSRGCIDLCGYDRDFFDAVNPSQGEFPVFVGYPPR